MLLLERMVKFMAACVAGVILLFNYVLKNCVPYYIQGIPQLPKAA